MSTRAAIIIVLAAVGLLYALGPGLAYLRGKRLRSELQPIVERFRAHGADLQLVGTTRSPAVLCITGTVPNESMKQQLHDAVRNIIDDEREFRRIVNGVRTQAEFDAFRN